MRRKPSHQLLTGALLVLFSVAMVSCSADNAVGPDNPAVGTQIATRGASIEGTWQPMESGTNEWLWGVWGTPNDEVIVVGNASTALHLRSGAWVAEAMPMVGDLCDVWMSGDGEALAVGLGGASAFWNGSGWEAVQRSSTANVFNVFGIPIFGSTLASLAPGIPPGALVAAGFQAISVSEGGGIDLFDGQSFMEVPSPTDVSLFGVWAEARSNIYAVGVGGTIIHFTGEVWAFENSPASENLSNVWGAAGNDIYAVGDFGTLLHFDGNAWSMIDLGLAQNLYGVWGVDSQNVFVVGAGGLILHFDGTQWTQMDSGTQKDLFKIWGRSLDEIFAVGVDGTILRFAVDVPPPPPPTDECPTFEEACQSIGEEVDLRCPADGEWKSHGEYVWCVIKTTAELVRDEKIVECFTKKERKKLFLCVVLDRIRGGHEDDGDDDGDNGDDCPSLDEACRIVGEAVDAQCTPGEGEGDHGYLWCVIETARDVLNDEEWRHCFNWKERKRIIKCVVRARVDDCDDNSWDDCGCEDDDDDYGDEEKDHDRDGKHDGSHGHRSDR